MGAATELAMSLPGTAGDRDGLTVGTLAATASASWWWSRPVARSVSRRPAVRSTASALRPRPKPCAVLRHPWRVCHDYPAEGIEAPAAFDGRSGCHPAEPCAVARWAPRGDVRQGRRRPGGLIGFFARRPSAPPLDLL